MNEFLLSILIWLPIIGGVAVLFFSKQEDAQAARVFSLAVSILVFALSIPLWMDFDRSTAAMQFVERAQWIPYFNVEYFLGVDGISMPLILLTTLLTLIVVISSWVVIQKRVAQYFAAFLIMEGVMIGVFAAQDAMLFYLFWEIMLLPMFLIIGIWGGPNRIYATIKFFLYTLLGSLLMLVALLYLYNKAGSSFVISDFHDLVLSMTEQKWIFVAFFMAFAVKVPMVPVHTWLPDAHVEAPTGGSVILAAIMLKLGGYGFLRFNLPITPDASHALSGIVITLSLIAVIYIAFVALVQNDMKKLIAYSSISHMGFATLGFFLFNQMALEGAMIQMISHGFISGAMFLAVGVLYDRLHSREISAYGGVAQVMPKFAFFAVLFAMANAGLPGTSGFVGEFFVILGAYQVNGWIAALAAVTLILGAAYTLWMVKRVMFGAMTKDSVAGLKDLSGREMLFMSILAGFTILVGVWPAPLLDVMRVTLENLLAHVAVSKL